MKPKISIVIPCYEMHGYGKEFLIRTLNSIIIQNFKDFEVIVSDHSVDNSLEIVCKNISNINIRYIKNENSRGSSSQNVNNGILNSNGEIIKILCQDDFLFDENSLLKTYNAFQNQNINWLVTKYIHTYDGFNFFNEHTPKLNENILFENTIGTHSCLSFINNKPLMFDENLIWFMDCELYKRMIDKFGNPYILKEITMIQGIWPGQVTHSIINNEIIEREKKYIISKHFERI